ncbi:MULTISPECIES: DUF58 domain-containing protein [unclassified Bacillus (in: firmicutes)]|uniref:DUF58 domain-containing protein n=1 Tax=unclassified Bacillus (in: firmicutes) TaxID=185979 RepID=UPI0008EFFCDB|nr:MULTISPECIES: DUF58 domain-containing protein [unclassified Bacillus (in: firmicutes)]SFB26156.1 Uncharacterized conserved protein, DUF58 family, contains vWF domain [Bacillus sp. UNCCL13]SFQ91909.1 Uncharacterized conserved protein, DUF58 family, contains vWF domain [Bacillus sp. cl95]
MPNVWSGSKKVWKFIVLVALIVVTFCYAMFQGGFVSWFLFYSFVPFALYGLGLSFYRLDDISLERKISKTDYNAGETLSVEILLIRKSRFPLFYLVVEDILNDSLKNAGRYQLGKTLLFPGFRTEFSFQYKVEDLPRGEHFLEELQIRAGDVLGLIEKQARFQVSNRIIVYPAFTEMIYRPFENHYDQGMTASRERVQRDTSMAIGVREYQPGDRFSWINWKATAKRNDIMTKEFEQRQSHDVYVVMDCAPEKRFETIVSFTASLLRSILRKGAQAGLLTISKERSSFPSRGGEGHLHQLFYHLAKIQAKCEGSIDRVLEAEKTFTQQNMMLMVVTGQLSKTLIEKASYFSQRSASVTIFLVKSEKEIPTPNEISLKASANARGVRVVLIHEGQFMSAFTEVNAG